MNLKPDTTKQCKRGHLLTPNNIYRCGKYDKCKACAKLWRANNLERVKQYQNEYRKLYPEVKAAYQKEYRKKNRKRLVEYSREANKMYSMGFKTNFPSLGV